MVRLECETHPKECLYGLYLYQFKGVHVYPTFAHHYAEKREYADHLLFAKTEKEGVLDGVPDGYEVSESKNGLPVLKRST